MIPNTHSAPTVATIRPLTAGPNTEIVLRESDTSPLASCRRAALTTCGIRPVEAGEKNAAAAPNRADVQTKNQVLALPVTITTTVVSSTAARSASQASITSRRGRRSDHTPPTSTRTARVPIRAARLRPSPLAPPTSSTANVSASGTRASPIAEVVWPSHSRRNGRSDSAPRREPSLMRPRSWSRHPSDATVARQRAHTVHITAPIR